MGGARRGRGLGWFGLCTTVVLALGACGGRGEAPEAGVRGLGGQPHGEGGDSGEVRWVRRSVGSDSEFTNGVTVDRDGNSILIGSYTGSARFGDEVLSTPPGFVTGFMAKYSSGGEVLWARGFGLSGPWVSLNAVAVDRHRHITVAGRVQAGADLGQGPLPEGAYLAQFSGDGELRWVRSIPAVGPYGALGPSLAADREGNLVLVGAFSGTLDFGGGPRSMSGGSGAFLASYTRHGAYRWDRVFNTSGLSHFTGVALDSSGHSHVVGYFAGEASFGGDVLGGPGPTSSVLAKFGPGGEHVFSQALVPEEGWARLVDVAVHGNRVVVVGSLEGMLRFDGDTLVGPGGLMLAYTRDGESRWGRVLGSERLVAVEADLEDDMTVLGLTDEEVGTGPLPGGAVTHAFVARFDRVHGEPRWTSVFGWPGAAFGFPELRLAVTRHGDTVVAGSFWQPIHLGPETLTPTTEPRYDAFLLRLWP